MTKKTIGLLTGGGDVPGLNPCMQEIVLRSLANDYRVIGIRRGWGGFINFDFDSTSTNQYLTLELHEEDVRTIDRTGGTFLHSSRTNPQKIKLDAIPDHLKNSTLGKLNNDNVTMDYTDHVLKVLEFLEIDTLISIGGDDTLSYSARLHQEGVPIVAIPKTMDNDVFGTDYCIGFSTAVSRSVEFIKNMRTCCGSHERIGVIELFGRNSGETSFFSGYLAHADRIIVPEVEFNMDTLIKLLIEDQNRNPSHYSILTVSEAAVFTGGTIIESGTEDAYGHRKLGGIGNIISESIKKLGAETMYQQIGYLMRSGPPDSLDLMVAKNFGALAVQSIEKNQTGRMVALQNGKYQTVPVDSSTQGKKVLDVDRLYDTENFRPKIQDVLGLPMFLT
jgi:6-phosphofructokinase 1